MTLRGFVANTDYDWFTFLRAIQPPVDEVNFWRPGSDLAFKALSPGQPIFFRLKAPRNVIAGFGYFVYFSFLPVSMAWSVYRAGNGAPTFVAMRERLLRIRMRFGMAFDAKEDFRIGCILVNQPVFWSEDQWIADARDWSPNIVQGKTYDLKEGEGQRIWLESLARSGAPDRRDATPELPGGYGNPQMVRPRLGQRSFRIAVLDSYDRRCAVTNERTLPALEAAHIRDFHEVEEHSINNGLLFRADIHKLFDSGYVTVTPDYHFEVSRRIKEEFENGHEYYELHGTTIRLPQSRADHPLSAALRWHNEVRYRG